MAVYTILYIYIYIYIYEEFRCKSLYVPSEIFIQIFSHFYQAPMFGFSNFTLMAMYRSFFHAIKVK